MTLIERDHLLAHIQELIKDHGTFRVLGQILKLKLMRHKTRRARHLPIQPHLRRDIGLPPEHKPPDPFRFLL